jgi:hypothetical protein
VPVRATRRAILSALIAIAVLATAAAPGVVKPTSVVFANASTQPKTDTTSTASAGAAVQTGTISGSEKVYVSVVETTPQTSDDVNTGMTQSAVQTMINKLNSYWSAQSNGMLSVELGGYETRSLGDSSCSPNDALSAEESDAFGGRFANDAWRGTHDHLMVLSAESCGAESFATVGGVGGEIFSGNGIDASLGVEFLLHEFGHNLGFEHADASICTNTSSYDATAANFTFTSTVCPTREYDDYFDIMGYTVKNATPNLSSPQRIMAGWLSNYALLTSTSSGSGTVTKTITALGGSGGTQALEIVDPTSHDDYYVEYRTDSGLDASSAEFNYALQCDPAMSGYTICELDSSRSTGAVRILRFIPFSSYHANGTTVMATGLTAGSSDKTKRHTHLNSGDSFTSVDDGFSLKITSMTPASGATIVVTFPSVAGHARAFTTRPLKVTIPASTTTADQSTTISPRSAPIAAPEENAVSQGPRGTRLEQVV